MVRFLFLPLLAVLLISCQPPVDWEKELAKETKNTPADLPVIDKITLEQRNDGLFYVKGSDTPFTGTDIEPDRIKEKEEGRMGFVMVTPYENGKIHGTKKTYYASGKLQEDRVYENGVPKKSLVFYSNGQKKINVSLNAGDKAEGAYLRWHKNGKVHTEGNFDAQERHHGTFKEYDDKGTLIGHYVWEHQKLVKVISETPEQKALRMEKKVFLPEEKAAASKQPEN